MERPTRFPRKHSFPLCKDSGRQTTTWRNQIYSGLFFVVLTLFVHIIDWLLCFLYGVHGWRMSSARKQPAVIPTSQGILHRVRRSAEHFTYLSELFGKNFICYCIFPFRFPLFLCPPIHPSIRSFVSLFPCWYPEFSQLCYFMHCSLLLSNMLR